MKITSRYCHLLYAAILLLVVCLFVGCGQDVGDNKVDVQPIKFSASTNSVLTRSANDSQNSGFDENTYVTIYPYKGTSTTLADPVYGAAFSSNGINYHTGNITTGVTRELLSTIPDPSYPNENSGQVTIVGVHPVIGSANFSGSTPTYTFTVSTDQSTAAAYKLSDLMTAKTTANRSENAIGLNFYHKLAKVTVTFHPNAGTPKICKVELLSITPSITVNVQTATVGATASGTSTNIICYNNAEGTTEETSVSAVMPVQAQKASGTAFIRFTFYGGGSIVWNLDHNLTLSAGNHYSYDLKVGLKTVGVLNTTVTDWVTDGSIETETDHTVQV